MKHEHVKGSEKCFRPAYSDPFPHKVDRCMESYASTRMTPVNHSPTRAARRAVIHRVESEYERFDCISDMHKFGVKVQQFL